MWLCHMLNETNMVQIWEWAAMRLRRRRSVTVSSLSCICVFTFSIVSLGSTCKLMVFPVKSAQRFAFHHEGPNAESIPLLDIVIRTGLSILELLSRKDQTLLVCICLPSKIEIRKDVSILVRVCQSPSCFPPKIRLYWIKRSGLLKAMKLHCGLLKCEKASL